MGAGKTTIGKQVAELLKVPFFDTDKIIEERTGADIGWIFDLEGEEGFRAREEAVIDEFTNKQGIVLATGGGAVANPENRLHLAGRGVVIHLETSIEQQLARTRPDKNRPMIDPSDPRASLEDIAVEREKLYREIADFIVSTDGHTVKNVAKHITDLIENNQFS